MQGNPMGKGLGREFLDFINRGNVVDLAAVVFVVVKSVERLRHRTAKADPAVDSQQQLAQAVERLSAALEQRRL